MEQPNITSESEVPFKLSNPSPYPDNDNVSLSNLPKTFPQAFEIEDNLKSSKIVKSQTLRKSAYPDRRPSIASSSLSDTQDISFFTCQGPSRRMTSDIENNKTSQIIYSEQPQVPSEFTQSELENLRKLKLFPIFGDENIAKFSVNYFLYLDFFRIAIKVFCIMFVFSGIVYIIALIKQDAIESSITIVLSVYGGFTIAAAILLKFLLSYEKRKLLENPILLNLQWTEDLFSVLVEGLPVDATEEDIREHFNVIVGPQCVKEVVLLQDSYKHAELKKRIQRIQNRLDKLDGKVNKTEKIKKEQAKLLLELEAKNSSLSQTEQELLVNGHYKGKAILIFHTPLAKSRAIKYFKVPLLLRSWILCCDSLFKKNRFKGNLLSVSEVPDPEDLIFQNVHAKRNIYKAFLAYIGSFIIIGASLEALVYLKANQLFFQMDDIGSIPSDPDLSYILAFGVTGWSLVLDKLIWFINIILSFKSGIKAQINVLNYGIFASFILYILMQVIPAFSGGEIWLRQLIKVLVLYFGKLILVKAFTLTWTTNTIKEASKSLTSPLLSKVTQIFHKKYSEFDFITGINQVVPLIFMPFTFLLLNPPILLGIAIISLYGCAVVDKYRMLRCCNLSNMRSSTFMIKTFRVFQWDLPCLLWGSILVIQAVWVGGGTVDNLVIDIAAWMIIIFAIVIVLVYICLSKSLNARFKRKFSEKNAEVEYDSVCKEFTTTYKEKDPVRQIVKSMRLDKSESLTKKGLL